MTLFTGASHTWAMLLHTHKLMSFLSSEYLSGSFHLNTESVRAFLVVCGVYPSVYVYMRVVYTPEHMYMCAHSCVHVWGIHS